MTSLSNRRSKWTAADPAAGIAPLRSSPLGERAAGQQPVRSLARAGDAPARVQGMPGRHQIGVGGAATIYVPESDGTDSSRGGASRVVLLIIATCCVAVLCGGVLIRASHQRQTANPPIAVTAAPAVSDNKSAEDSSTSRSAPGGSDSAAGSGYIWPTTGTVTQEFGCTDFELEPWNAALGCRFHYGIDIANVPGTPILAAAAGRVVEAGWGDDGYGFRVVVEDANGTRMLYGHLCCAPDVVVGQAVQQGEQIGLMGTTGASSGPHLHFAVEVDGVNVDPREFLPAQ